MRVLTLNLHNPSASALGSLAAFLDASGAEALALTECGRAAAEGLARALDCEGLVYAPAPYWGNALLTRTLAVEGSAAVELPASSLGETRSAAVADLRMSGVRTRLIATHLDHLTEPDRVRQLQHLAASVDLTEGVLMGDLNALTRADYDTARWEELGVQRLRAGVSPARTEVTDWLREDLAMEDAHDARPEGAPLSATCPYGTRVDYVLIGPRCPMAAVPGSYRVLDSMSGGLTDHDAVTVELAPRLAPADRVVRP